MKLSGTVATAAMLAVASMSLHRAAEAADFQRLKYNNPALVVDLGVGLWAHPVPIDFDDDGDYDLVVSTTDVPHNGTYFFENPDGDVKHPVFKPAVRVGPGRRNLCCSCVDGTSRVLTPGREYVDFADNLYQKDKSIPYKKTFHAGRANQWTLCDFDGDGNNDLIIGACDWREYGWDNAFNSDGEWTRGPLHGYVYFVRNAGTDAEPKYEKAVRIRAGDGPLDVFGCPSPNLADWDDDDDLDIICGEFLDKLSYFENIGSRKQPRYAKGRFLKHDDALLTMDLQMMQVRSLDWDSDGDIDLIIGQEDGRVALVENTGELTDGMPHFLPPVFFKQQADAVMCGGLATPCCFDWDGDGDEDIISGDTAGYINFVENLDGGDPPKWAAPRYLKAGSKVIRIQAGYNGSIQGPCEAKWGYTVLSVADWNHDGLPDIMINSIWGKVQWYRNVGSRTEPKLKAAQPVRVQWPGPTPKPEWNWWNPEGKQLVTQWRTSPVIIDLNRDGLNDLVMLDHEGYMAFFERRKTAERLQLLPGKRIFRTDDNRLWRPNPRKAGKSGRRKFTIADWDGDGRLDFIMNSRSVDFLRNTARKDGEVRLKNMGRLGKKRLAGHTSCPATVDWNGDGMPDLLVGAEDGFFYYLKHPEPKARMAPGRK